MDHRGIFIANLAKGQDRGAGGEFPRLAFALASATRRDGAQRPAPENRVPFFAHIDEFQILRHRRVRVAALRSAQIRGAFLSREPVH